MIIRTEFEIGQLVNIDGDKSIAGVILAITVRHPGYIQYEVSWFHEGNERSAWFTEPRLGVAT